MEAWWAALPGTLTAVALVSLVLAALLLIASLLALRRRRILSSAFRLLLAAFFGMVVAVAAMVGLGIHGYQTLTKEESAAVVSVEPAGPQRFSATFLFPDGSSKSYTLAGDDLYVDARILKWKYWANVLGLHTAYELDRVAGRYRTVEDELAKPRTLQSLADERKVDLFGLRKRFEALAPFYDAEYGSATFVPADRPVMYEILVSTTGLLARPVRSAAEPLPE